MLAEYEGRLRFGRGQVGTVAPDALFQPPEKAVNGATMTRVEVDAADLHRSMAAMLNFAAERLEDYRAFGDAKEPDAMTVVARDDADGGLLCRYHDKTILMMAGTPHADGRRTWHAIAARGAKDGRASGLSGRRRRFVALGPMVLWADGRGPAAHAAAHSAAIP